MADQLEVGRAAARRHHWDEALKTLTEVDEREGLGPDDLLLLADAAWWAGDPETGVAVLERAYAGYERGGRRGEAATVGARLAYLAMRRLAMSVAMGWIARVERLLEGTSESIGHAWLEVLSAVQALMMHRDLDTTILHTDRALALGRKYGNIGVQSIALSFKGYALVERGEWREGLVLMDEATAVAMSQEADLRSASDVYCNTIAVCRNLADYRRAGEWTEQAERWMRSNAVGGYPGVCQVHRAELKRLHGSWPEAEEEARRACVELERFRLMDGIGFAHYEIGEVRRRMGDLEAAEESFVRAYEYGWEPQPGRALLMLQRGETAEAARSIAASLERFAAAGSGSILARARLLPAQVEIALAAEDIDTARTASDELDVVMGLFDSPAWEASALGARGAIHLHEGRTDEAIADMDRAWRLWQEIDLPYESARARTLLGRARAAAGDAGGAGLEFAAVRSAFTRLGAAADLQELRASIPPDQASERRRVTKAFMFTDIVTSTDLLGLLGDDAWEEVLRWHDRTLRAIFTTHGGEEVKHTGDGFFVAFDGARQAVECAVAIQRRLEEHRRQHGFAPSVRIGIHAAEAFQQIGDYSGQGVHVAARIGALGDREEILISSDLASSAGDLPFPLSEIRAAELKGVAQPVEVRSVDWR